MIKELVELVPGQIAEDLDIKDKEYTNELFKDMSKRLLNEPSAYFITAPQIGVNKRAGIVLIPGLNPILLVNPKIVNKNWEIPFIESNISFPNQLFETFRYASITVKSDNFPNGNIRFGVKEDMAKIILKDIENYAHPNIHQAVAIQQVIDILDGKNSDDKKNPQSFDFKKHGRNEVVEIEKDGESKKIKYKKAIPFLQQGWTIKKID